MTAKIEPYIVTDCGMLKIEHYIVTDYGMLKVHPAVVAQMEGVRQNKDGSYDRRTLLGKRFAMYEQDIVANARRFP